MLLAQLNRYLAHALEQSPRARELCAALEGRRLKLEIEGLPGALVINVAHGTLRVTHAASGAESSAVDVTVHGSPVSLLALIGGDAAAAVGQGGASVVGEESQAQQFQELSRLLRPDLEAATAKVVGRMPAHLATRAFTLFAGWAGAARESVARNAADYLAHESRDLVPRAEAESFFTGVEALRAAVARAEVRVGQAGERVAALAPRGAA